MAPRPHAALSLALASLWLLRGFLGDWSPSPAGLASLGRVTAKVEPQTDLWWEALLLPDPPRPLTTQQKSVRSQRSFPAASPARSLQEGQSIHKWSCILALCKLSVILIVH